MKEKHDPSQFLNVFKKQQEITFSFHQRVVYLVYSQLIKDGSRYTEFFHKKLSNLGFNSSNLLLFLRFWEYASQSIHLLFLICSGLYHNAHREMRFFLESWSQGYFIDHLYPERDLSGKLNPKITKEINLFGKLLFNRQFFKKDLFEEMKEFHQKFSKFVYSSQEETERFREAARPLTEALTLYQKEDFEKSINYLIRTHSLLLTFRSKILLFCYKITLFRFI